MEFQYAVGDKVLILGGSPGCWDPSTSCYFSRGMQKFCGQIATVTDRWTDYGTSTARYHLDVSKRTWEWVENWLVPEQEENEIFGIDQFW